MSDAVARPVTFTGFVLREKYRRVEIEQPEYAGLWAEVRTNLSHAERADFLSARDDANRVARDGLRARMSDAATFDAAVENAGDDAAKTAALAARELFLADYMRSIQDIGRDRFAIVAPFVRAWNVCDDVYQDVPPPIVNAIGAYEWIDDVISDWLFSVVAEGYKGGPKESSLSPPSSAPPPPLSDPPNENGTVGSG